MKKILCLLLSVILLSSSGCSRAVLRSAVPNGDLTNKLIYCLPKGMIRINTATKASESGGQPSPKSDGQSKDVGQEVLEITPVFVPDPNHYYTLEHRTNISFDDDVKIIQDNKGFLKQINVTTTSQVPAILMEMLEIAKATLKLFGLRAPGDKIDILVDPDDLGEYFEGVESKILELLKVKEELKAAIGLIEETQLKLRRAKSAEDKNNLGNELINAQSERNKIASKLQTMEDTLTKAGIQYQKYIKYAHYGVKFIAVSWQKNKLLKLPLNADTAEGKDPFKGIFYRPVLPCKVIILAEQTLVERMFYFPNKSPVIAFDIKRPAFTKTIKNLTFTEGVLTEIYLKKDSELLAALKIPSEILKSVAGLPLELLQFRVQRGQGYEQLLTTQIHQIQLERQLLELQMQKMQQK